MRVLLDTHTFLWFVAGDARLSAVAQQMIADPMEEPLLSVASLWEIAIKLSLGKLAIQGPFTPFISEQLRHNGISLLGITLAHTAHVTTLPFYDRDPFDRLLVAQAHSEHLPIISADKMFDAYGVTRLW